MFRVRDPTDAPIFTVSWSSGLKHSSVTREIASSNLAGTANFLRKDKMLDIDRIVQNVVDIEKEVEKWEVDGGDDRPHVQKLLSLTNSLRVRLGILDAELEKEV